MQNLTEPSPLGGPDYSAAVGRAQIEIRRFYSHTSKDFHGNVVTEDWVDYVPLHMRTTAQIPRRVKDILDIEDITNPDDLKVESAHMMKAAVEPQYRQWKGGGKAEMNGVPLEKWTGVTAPPPSYLPYLKAAGLLTVEMLADASDTVITNVHSIPDMVNLRQNARRFIDMAKPQPPDAEKLELMARLEKQDAQMTEMAAMLNKLLAAGLATEAAKTEPPKPQLQHPQNQQKRAS